VEFFKKYGYESAVKAVLNQTRGRFIHLTLAYKYDIFIREVRAMPRIARQKSQTGIYHAMLRGINRQNIFEDDEDRTKFLETVNECRKISGYKLFGYCLMGNHIHMLIKEEKEPIELIFKRIGARYVYWYNWKYQRSGHLFQDRFRSEVVEDDGYFLTVLRYILQNPVKAGLTTNVSEYKWSSYNDYIQGDGITDIEFVLDIFALSKEKSIERFTEYINEPSDDKCLELKEIPIRITDQELLDLVKKEFNTEAIRIQNLQVDEQKRILKYLKELEGTTYQQISRLTGVTVYRIFKA
jgi:REP element-mobilizing transposase RayT